MKNLSIITLFASCLTLVSYIPLNIKPNKVQKVVIDAGHGGKDSGCFGKKLQEKDVCFAVAMEVGVLIKANFPDVQVVYTRTKESQFVELRERARLANREHGDLFMSIHCNAAASTSVSGTETYIMGLNEAELESEDVALRENSAILNEIDYLEKYDGFDPESPMSHIILANYQNTFQTNSLRFAANIEHEFEETAQRKSRGVKQSSFVVLWKTAMPSVLVEVGFLTNQEEENYLANTNGKKNIAYGLFKAFENYKNSVEVKNIKK
ncbi:MAG: N-acetylmuramoyl-L-alanine amidase [Cytophagales bacterium]|nr:MAG: N-acetylmuramoyl-L-alanine amidase [Cytophagales bacterium]